MTAPLPGPLPARTELLGLTLRLAGPWAAVLALASCDPDPEFCRFDPWCSGGIGAICAVDRDCIHGHCCTTGNCGGGMCTVGCGQDQDCPPDMLCEHTVCFFMCAHDRDCAAGMSCKHGKTVCEWD